MDSFQGSGESLYLYIGGRRWGRRSHLVSGLAETGTERFVGLSSPSNGTFSLGGVPERSGPGPRVGREDKGEELPPDGGETDPVARPLRPGEGTTWQESGRRILSETDEDGTREGTKLGRGAPRPRSEEEDVSRPCSGSGGGRLS